jgi:excisionase family DNA binding protein
MVADRPEFLSVRDAAQLFKVCPATIRRWVREKKLPALQVGGGAIRVVPPRVESWGCAIESPGNTTEG